MRVDPILAHDEAVDRRRWFNTIGVGLAVWVAQRLALIVAMACDGPIIPRLTRWDGKWYSVVAAGGYHWPRPLFGHTNPWISDLAFLPGLPALGRGIILITGLPPRTAIFIAGQMGFLAAAAVIAAVGFKVATPTVAVLLVACWGAAPRAVVESMGYTEGWFIALVGLGLLAILSGRPITAGAFVAVAGLFRASVAPVCIVFGIAWLTSVVRRESGQRWRRFVGMALSPLGLLTWFVIVACRTGRWNGYLLVQKAWGSEMGTLRDTWDVLQSRMDVVPFDWRYIGLIALTWCLYLVLGIVMARRREPVWLTVYVLVTVIFVAHMQGYFNSKARFLLPAFPAFLPVARLLDRAPRWLQAVFVLVISAVSTWWSLDVLGHSLSP
ncbi:hypothetical protein FYJ43_08075 [Cutibacterium sp. WCA-380-WT-3A]|uniref:Uncharacterized protein n=1 Tax=Cutibacterium porci TaxID=2605781 RepID=A0A7K0J7Q5_9ACTN|nr:hypothetical protein [Cutibacterium porci]MSS45994.1 hypothetical protein [Cutibacterium porci]